VDLYPHGSVSGMQFRVVGRMTGGNGGQQFSLYKDAGCTQPLSTNQSNTTDTGVFMVMGQAGFTSGTAASTSVYVRPITNDGTTPACTFAGTFHYSGVAADPMVSAGQGTGKYFGQQLSAMDVSGGNLGFMVGGVTSGTGTHAISYSVNGGASNACSGGSGSFSCSINVPAASVPDGEVKVTFFDNANGTTADDVMYFVKDSIAPGIQFTTPASGTVLTAATATAVPLAGSCGMSGNLSIRLYAQTGSGDVAIANVTCASGSFSFTTDLSTFLPDGQIELVASIWDSAGQHESRSYTRVNKSIAIADLYSSYPNAPTVANAMASSASNLYAVGSGAGVGGTRHWLARSWSGSNWSSIDDYQANSAYNSEALAATTDASGNLYVVGYADGGTGRKWASRKCVAGTCSAMGQPAMDYGTGHDSILGAVAVSGPNVVVAGSFFYTDNQWHWGVGVSTTSGSGWGGGVDVTAQGLPYGSATGAVFDGSTIYLVGYGMTSGQPSSWVVAQSSDGGATFTQVTSQSFYSGGMQKPTAVVSDSTGSLYIAGVATDASGVQHWLVEHVVGTTWTQVDDFAPAASNPGAQANAELISGGYLYVGGTVGFAPGSASPPPSNWVVRRMPIGGGAWTSSGFAATGGGSVPVGAYGLGVSGGTVYSCGAMGDMSSSSQTDWIVKKEISFQ
jgi:hypothetical protein